MRYRVLTSVESIDADDPVDAAKQYWALLHSEWEFPLIIVEEDVEDLRVEQIHEVYRREVM